MGYNFLLLGSTSGELQDVSAGAPESPSLPLPLTVFLVLPAITLDLVEAWETKMALPLGDSKKAYP